MRTSMQNKGKVKQCSEQTVGQTKTRIDNLHEMVGTIQDCLSLARLAKRTTLYLVRPVWSNVGERAEVFAEHL